MDPINNMFKYVLGDMKPKYEKLLTKLGIHLNTDEAALTGKKLLKCIM